MITRGSAGRLFALIACTAPAAAQLPNFGPMSADLRLSQNTSYDQVWADVARSATRVGVTWSAGQDVGARFFDTRLVPVTGDLWVNSSLFLEVQDEPAIAASSGGHWLIAWSERHGYDGQLMGIFARLYDANGAPSGGEFQVNVDGLASQWRPLIAPRVGGGFLVAWSGDWDGDSFFRIYADNGAPLSGDVRVNAWEFDAQVDPALAQAADGTIFVAFVDFSGQGGVGTGLNLWGRTFNAAGVAQQAFEFPLVSGFAVGDQREPRVAVDGLSRFIVVYQDTLADGSGNAVMCRRFANDGTPLGVQFRVNTTTFSDQLEARVVAAADGSFLVTWLDYSQGTPRVLGQRFDPSASPAGAEFQVNELAVGTSRHNVAATADFDDVYFAYDALGDQTDVYARRWRLSDQPVVYGRAKTNSQGCLPSIGWSGTPSFSSATPFTIEATNVLNNKAGLLLYGYGSSFTPFEGGTLLVAQPLRRTGAQDSGGNPPPNDCSGTFSYDFRQRMLSGADPLLVPGTTVSAQWRYRDLQDSTGYGTGLTNGLRFTIAP